jgi:hypothetical protein
MLAIASDFVTRAAKALFAGAGPSALWTITVGDRVVGSVVQEGEAFRLAWFPGADPRLAIYRGPIDDDAQALADALARRLGARDALAAGISVSLFSI